MNFRHNRPGQVLIIAIIFMAVILILASALFPRVADIIRNAANTQGREQAINLAEAGVDRAIWQLNETAGAYPGETNTQLGTTGTFTVSVETKSSSLKTITSTGTVPNPKGPYSKRTVKVDIAIDSSQVAFRFAAQVGSGGATLSNSATINGNLYSNSNITAGNGNQQTINGDAFAVGTVDEPPINVTGNTVIGASPQPLPDINESVEDAKSATEDGGIINCATTPSLCTLSSSVDIGPKKYLGNLTLTNNAIFTMKGPIWVTGNFTMSQGGTTLKLDEGFGSNSAILLVDGLASLTQGGVFRPTSSSPKGYIMLVTNSTSSQAITLAQTGATAIFYALNGGAELSQTANVASLVANTLTMSQSATLNYETGLSSSQFSTGPGGSWQIKKGTYRHTASP